MNLLQKSTRQILRKGKNELRKLKLKLQAKKVYCICCGIKSIAFLPYGVIKRPNAQCPGCGSLERHRLHWYYMVNKTNLFKADKSLKILHVAPEDVFYNKFYNNPKFEYTPCAKFGEGFTDTYPEGTINIDITEIALPDNSFDIIYCSHVLEHVPDDIKAMKEFLRVLKPGGWAMLQVPLDNNRDKTYEDFSIVDPAEREKAFGQYDHVRVYGRDYMDRLKSAGFTVKKEQYQKELSDKEISKYGFMKDEDIFICTKN